MKQILKAFFILAILCSCKIKQASQKVEDPYLANPKITERSEAVIPVNSSAAPLRSDDVKKFSEYHNLTLHDYEFNDNSDFAEVSRKRILFNVQAKTLREEVAQAERRRKGKSFSKRILNAAEKYDVVLADITENGYFYDVQSKKLVENSKDGCFFTAFDYETGVFYSRNDFWVAPFFTFLNLKFNVLISGQLCVSGSGRIKTYKNNGPLSIPGLGLENFISILLSRGIAFIDQHQDGENFNLAGSSFFRKIKKLVRKAELPDSLVTRALSDKLEAAKIRQKSNLHSVPGGQVPNLEAAVSVGDGVKAVPVQMSFAPNASLPPNNRGSNIAGLFLIQLTNFGSIKQLSAQGNMLQSCLMVAS